MHNPDLHYCRMCAKLFELSVIKGYDSYDFTDSLMTSRLGNEIIFNRSNTNIWLGETYVMSVIEEDISLKKGEPLESEFMHWVGYLFMYWHMTYGTCALEIIERAPMHVLVKSYTGLHCLSPELAIENLNELHESLLA